MTNDLHFARPPIPSTVHLHKNIHPRIIKYICQWHYDIYENANRANEQQQILSIGGWYSLFKSIIFYWVILRFDSASARQMRMCLAIPVLATFSVLSPPSAFNSVSGIRLWKYESRLLFVSVPSFLAERKMRPPFLISPLPPSFAPRSPPLFSFCFSFQYYRQQLTTSSLSDGEGGDVGGPHH